MEIIVNTENLYNRISKLLKVSRERTIRDYGNYIF